MNTKLYVIIVLICLTILFTIQNTEVVAIRLLFWKVSMSRSLLVFFLVFLGIVIGWLFANRSTVRKIGRKSTSKN